MRIAFYAPLKAPDHPVPSGDRRLAELFVQALQACGHEVQLASRLRSFDRNGDLVRQQRLERLGACIAERLLARYAQGPRPELWFTYHVYHKAPDWLGPRISAALCIPYIVAEASVAPTQQQGPWALGHAQAMCSVQQANRVLCVNPVDVGQLARVRLQQEGIDSIAPFIDVAAFAGAAERNPRPSRPDVRLVTVAMMRDDAKLASYRQLARALAAIEELPWQLLIVGDGPARAMVEQAFASFAARTRFAGALPAPEVASALHGADVLVWPAIDEAFGMVLLEAQACGLPVVVGRSGGVPSVVREGETGLVVPCDDAGAFARAIARLIGDHALRERMGLASHRYARAQHDIGPASQHLDAILQRTRARHIASTSEHV